MVPYSSRQLLVWSLPTLAFLFSLLWYRRKRGASLRSDPGGATWDTGSISGDTVQQSEDLQISTTTFLSAEKQLTNKEQLCEIVAIALDNTKSHTDKSKSLLPIVTEESQLEAAYQQGSELVLEKVLSVTAPTVCIDVPGDTYKYEDLDISEIDAKKERKMIQETNAVDCPVDKLDQELCSQKIPAKSVVKETKIAMLEGSVCNGLESPEHLTDKISGTNSSAAQVEGKEVVETTNTNLSTSVDAYISPQESPEYRNLLPEVYILAVSDPLESIAQKKNSIEGGLEDLPLNRVSTEEICGKLQALDIEIQQDNRDICVGLQGSEGEVQVLPLNIDISEDLEFVKSVEKDIDSVQLMSDIQTSSSVEDSDSISSVDSSSVATTLMAHESSTEASTVENHSHDNEDAKKSRAAAQRSDSVSLECKLPSLELNENAIGEASSDAHCVLRNGAVAGSFSAASEQQRTERDSANHSPADVMLASPSISSYSDAQSEGSSDSGKGCSDVATPSQTPASGGSLSGDAPVPSVYEFVLPQHLVGRLIGRHGCFVHQIKAKTNASILIKRHPDTQKLKICAVEGTQADIESALEMIRQKFPEKRYPNVTLEQVCFLPPVSIFPLIPECLQLPLVEGVNNDVILSSLMSPAHFFLQQPTHPTFPALNRLNACMNICYSEPTAPPLPSPVQAGVICVAPTMGGWYRAQVVAVDTETDTCDIKFLDYGGYLTVNISVLRQIRADYMTLPFQAAECYMSNVTPIGGDEALWSKESIAGMEELTHGQVLQAQVCGYAEDGLPMVYLYAIHGSQVVLVNQELVLRGLAEWVEPAEA